MTSQRANACWFAAALGSPTMEPPHSPTTTARPVVCWCLWLWRLVGGRLIDRVYALRACMRWLIIVRALQR